MKLTGYMYKLTTVLQAKIFMIVLFVYGYGLEQSMAWNTDYLQTIFSPKNILEDIYGQ